MTVGKLPPRAPRSSSAPKSTSSAKPASPKRREARDSDAPQPKKSSAPDNLGPLDYLVEYKELALIMLVGLIGYMTYAYFQPYFAAEEAAKQRPVISSQMPSAVAAPPSAGIREAAPPLSKPAPSTSTAVVTQPSKPAPVATNNSSTQVTPTPASTGLVETPGGSSRRRSVPPQTIPSSPPAQQPTQTPSTTPASQGSGKPIIGSRIPSTTPKPNTKPNTGAGSRPRPDF